MEKCNLAKRKQMTGKDQSGKAKHMQLPVITTLVHTYYILQNMHMQISNTL